ncbi:MAG: hypothetical protein IJP65_01375 [Bacteroidales bacterium]|nr:hypothetical protein [Bacteroidales bacterium]
MKKICCLMICASAFLLSGCKREIRIEYETPLKQEDYRLFFLGLSKKNIIEMPFDGKLCSKDLDDIEDKVPNFLLFYKGNLVYYSTIALKSIQDHFYLHFILHPSQSDATVVLEIIYQNRDSSHLNYHEYAVLNLEEGCEPPEKGCVAYAAWRQVKESMN